MMASKTSSTPIELKRTEASTPLWQECYEILQESIILLINLIVKRLCLAKLIIIAAAGLMLLLDARHFKQLLQFSTLTQGEFTFSSIVFAEGLTAMGDIINALAPYLTSLCFIFSLFSLILLSGITLYHMIDLIHTYRKNDHNTSEGHQKLIEKSVTTLFHCFFLFSAVTAFVSLGPISLAIATACMAILLISMVIAKRILCPKLTPDHALKNFPIENKSTFQNTGLKDKDLTPALPSQMKGSFFNRRLMPMPISKPNGCLTLSL